MNERGRRSSEDTEKSAVGYLTVAKHIPTEATVKSLLSRMNSCFLPFDICD